MPAAWLLLAALAAAPSAASPAVLSCELSGTVDAGSADYLRACVKEAEDRGATALLVTLDTPGGSLEATRQIVRAFLGARVPVLVWVGPSGARAGSAGVFLTLASHLAGMAPGTNIGAAHPVSGLGGRDPEAEGGEHLGRKVENDAAAFAQALARQRGRNARWAESAVRESASVTGEEARDLGVVEVMAPTVEAFLAAAHGREVTTAAGEVALETRGADVVSHAPTWGQRLVHGLANPAVAWLLFLVAISGLTLELSHPGLVAPGLVGLTSLVLALVAFSALPIQAGGVVLLVLGILLIAAELFVASGLLGAGGVVLLALGGLFLVDRFDPGWFVEPSFRIPARLVIPSAVALGGLAAYAAVKAAQTRRVPQATGDLGMVGERGRALTEVGSGGGEVFAHGERWRAVSHRPVPKDAPVVVREVRGLTLLVEEEVT